MLSLLFWPKVITLSDVYCTWMNFLDPDCRSFPSGTTVFLLLGAGHLYGRGDGEEVNWGQFHQYFTSEDPKSAKKTDDLTVFFTLLGYVRI